MPLGYGYFPYDSPTFSDYFGIWYGPYNLFQNCKIHIVLKPKVSLDVTHLPNNNGSWDINSPEFLLQINEENEYSVEPVRVAADSSKATMVMVMPSLNSVIIYPELDPFGANKDKYGYFQKVYTDNQVVKFQYLHPQGIPTANPVKMIVQDAATGDILRSFYFEIVRPPVLLLHGLGSSASSMTYLKNHLISQGYADFPNGYVNAFSYNANIPVGFTYNSVHEFSQSLITSAKNNYQVSAGKVDVVGYSMGGLLSRAYLQSSQYRNDLNKLITINTPHSGSELANHPLAALYAFFKQQPAIMELRTNSFSIDVLLNGPSLNKHVVPSHTIASTWNIECPGSNSDNWVEEVLYQICHLPPLFLCNSPDWWDCIFDGSNENDGMVSLLSQHGGITGTVISNDLFHTLVNENALTAQQVNMLLGLSNTSSAFSHTGFNPAMINATAPAADRNVLTINFLSPADNTVFAPGQVVHFSIDGSNDVQKGLLAFHGPFLDTIQIAYFAGADLEFDYTLPGNASGTFRIGVIGADEDSLFALDTLTLHIEGAPLQEITPGAPGETKFVVAPNPGSVGFDVTLQQGDDLFFEGELFSATGKKLLSFTNAGISSVTVDGSHLPKGVFLLVLRCEGYTTMKKWVKV